MPPQIPEGAEGPYARYLRSRGVGTPGGIPFSSRAARYIESQYDRAQALRDIQAPLYEDLGIPTRLPYEYAKAFGDRAARNLQGEDILKSFLNMDQPLRTDLGYTFEPFYDENQVGFNEGRKLEMLQNIIRAGRMGLGRSTAGNYLAGRVPYMLDQWETLQPSVGGAATPFVDWLADRFGLKEASK